MKKALKLFTITLLLVTILYPNQSIYALPKRLGDVGYWHAQGSEIGRWNTTPRTRHILRGQDGFSNSDFLSYVNHARSQWKNAGITINNASSESNANLRIYGGTWANLSFDAPGLKPEYYGLALRTKNSSEGYWYYIGNRYRSFSITEADIFIVYRSNGTSNQYKNTTTHELGHGLGWYSHATSSGNVMSSAPSSRTQLTLTDKRHLTQIYYR